MLQQHDVDGPRGAAKAEDAEDELVVIDAPRFVEIQKVEERICFIDVDLDILQVAPQRGVRQLVLQFLERQLRLNDDVAVALGTAGGRRTHEHGAQLVRHDALLLDFGAAQRALDKNASDHIHKRQNRERNVEDENHAVRWGDVVDQGGANLVPIYAARHRLEQRQDCPRQITEVPDEVLLAGTGFDALLGQPCGDGVVQYQLGEVHPDDVDPQQQQHHGPQQSSHRIHDTRHDGAQL
mmetsp:Transcript_3149/g.8900  ORF Transcript_3149/g.8900 Transcript_3149/m.8900 type:complete len:238 (+) Transcript_3149:83-796(+)